MRLHVVEWPNLLIVEGTAVCLQIDSSPYLDQSYLLAVIVVTTVVTATAVQLLLDIRGIYVCGFEYSRFTYDLLGPNAITVCVQFLLVKPDSRI